MKKTIISIVTAVFLASSCSYLDIVPDNIPTMEMAFQTRTNAEKMLYTCYNYIPNNASPWGSPGIGASDEVWNCAERTYYYTNETAFRVAKGLQNVSDPYQNYWSGGQNGSNLFIGIRDCNIFLDNIDKVPDITDTEKNRWIAEVKFIKAYLHIWLLQLYGPIPYIDKNIDVSASPDEVKVVREPVDVVVSKISALLDEAINMKGGLPDYIRATDTELGRITKPAAMAIKARLLTYAASPLFNGNEDYIGYKDANGVNLINPVYDKTKWERARDACKDAIDAALTAGHDLYEFDEIIPNLSDTTFLELTLRNTITAQFGKELLWGLDGQNTRDLMRISGAPLTDYHYKEIEWFTMQHNPTMELVEEFYTNHGVPISEDKTYDYEHRYNVVDVPEDHNYYADTTGRTAMLHLYREPRFYAWIGFDQGKWFNMEVANDEDSYVLHCKKEELAGRTLQNYSITGFFAKKLIPYSFVFTQATNTGEICSHYPFPIIRLSDLYLLYAECLNECKDIPDDEVYEYIQKVRSKAGLDMETGSLVATWEKYSDNPDKPKTKDGMREIIRQERLIELCLEGQRFYDLRRWKLCVDYLNRPVRGWSVTESDEAFYTPAYIFFREFTPRDYFWPIKLDDLYRNNKLQQSPLW